jgi:aldose 1-epimerase
MMVAQVTTFGTTADGRKVDAIHLTKGELRATILTSGARLQDLRLAGAPWPLTLGASTVAAYEGPFAYFGAIVGPVANRISGATAMIDGAGFDFAANEPGPITLHSGPTGTHAQVWQVRSADQTHVTLCLPLADGLGGFPGNRVLHASFVLEAPATLQLTLTATTDAPTLMNLANHSYWNLDGSTDIAEHQLMVAADRYLPVDSSLVPQIPAEVTNTGFDFRRLRRPAPDFRLDHNFCLTDAPGPLRAAASLAGGRGVRLDLATTAPGLQVYDGAGLETTPHLGLTGQPYGPGAGIALEPQHWPNAANRPDFAPILLRPGSTWQQTSVFSLSRSENG